MLDLTLAVIHHLAIFALFGVLIAELILVKRELTLPGVALLAKVDMVYGVLSVLILAVGFSRAIFASKGWAYFSHNAFFWAKVGTFLLVAVLSIWPTLHFMKWKRSGSLPSASNLEFVRRMLWIEIALFALLPVFAAAMARGFGEF